MRSTWVVVYDIAEDRRRIRAAKVLEAFGVRVQESVFECRIEEDRLRRLQKQLSRIVKTGDLMRIYRVCDLCLRASLDWGGGTFAQNKLCHIAE